jgi:3-hydroxyacyl-CoA dehydrogenase
MAVLQASRMRKGQPAPASIAECVKAAIELNNFVAGCEVEKVQFTKLMYSTESRALRHLFFAERLAGKVSYSRPSPPDFFSKKR